MSKAPLMEDSPLILSFDADSYSWLAKKLEGNETYRDLSLISNEHLYSVGIELEYNDPEQMPEDLKIILKHCQEHDASYFRFIEQ